LEDRQSLKNDKILIHEQKKSMRQIRWLIFWVLISLNVVTLSIDAIFSFIETTTLLNYARMLIIHILAVLIPLVIYFKTVREPESQKISLRLNKFSFMQGLMIVILAAAGQFIMAILNVPMVLLQTNVFQIEMAESIIISSNSIEFIVGVAVMAIIPAILEEILFRGVIFGGTERQSTIFAVLFSTFVFALVHPNIFNFAGLIFLGLMTVMVMLRTNSIYAAILYHFINNLTAFLFFQLSHSAGYINVPLTVFMILGAIVVFIVSIFIFRIITPNAPKYKDKKAAPLLLRNIFSVPIILCMVITVAVQYFVFFR